MFYFFSQNLSVVGNSTTEKNPFFNLKLRRSGCNFNFNTKKMSYIDYIDNGSPIKRKNRREELPQI